MSYDEKVPLILRREQQWFGSIIGRPIDAESRMESISPSGRPMEEEAAEHIAPSPTLRPAERIQIYNQQYWWRLLNTLHESFPLATRLLGYFDFNRLIGFPYLTKYPPKHWSLSFLGDQLAKWCREDYAGRDKELLTETVELDWAFTFSFTCGSLTPVTLDRLSDPEAAAAIFDQKLFIQPFIFLFDHDYDLFKYRNELLMQGCDYWINHGFPVLDCAKHYYHVLYRNKQNNISWKEISQGEHFILGLFQKGTSIDNVCELLEKQEPTLYEAAAQNLQLWFQEWAQREWLSFQDAQEPVLN